MKGVNNRKMINDFDFQAEIQYRTIMNITGSMLKHGLVTENEMNRINTIMLEKYRPVLGTLLSGKPLV